MGKDLRMKSHGPDDDELRQESPTAQEVDGERLVRKALHGTGHEKLDTEGSESTKPTN